MAFSIRITFDDDTELARGYRLSELVQYMKKHSLCGVRAPVPVLPWLIDAALEYAAEGPHRNAVKRIDVQEKVTI
jgi:hypothetical protein